MPGPQPHPGRVYRIRVRVTDSNGVSRSPVQVLTGIRFNGGNNVALGKTVTVNPPGWACCSSPQNGFVWPGGTSCHNGGCPAGDNKTATVDLAVLTPINRVAVWFHDAQRIPQSWKIETSTDGANYQQVHAAVGTQCRAANAPLKTDWSFPACFHTASFPSVDARYVRYRFDDTTLFAGLHGWVLEIEVFRSGNLTIFPSALDFNNQPVQTTSAEKTIQVTNSGLTPVTLRPPTVTWGTFSIKNRCPAVLNVNSSCFLGVQYTPGSSSPASGTLSINHDGKASPSVVQLNGTSAPSGPTLRIEPTSLQFPAVGVGAQTAEQIIVVASRGVPPGGAIQAVLSSSSFILTNNCTVVTNGSCQMRVRFAPKVSMTFSEKLTIIWPNGSQDVRLFGSALADTDGDGIPDAWERGTVTIRNDTINLAAMGSSVGVKDVFVELDYLQDAGHTHKPKPEAIKKVIDAFWRKGIALHVDCGPACVMDPASGATWGVASQSDALPHLDPITGSSNELGFVSGGYSWASFDDIKSRHLRPARSVIFRYGIFAHDLAGGDKGPRVSRALRPSTVAFPQAIS